MRNLFHFSYSEGLRVIAFNATFNDISMYQLYRDGQFYW